MNKILINTTLVKIQRILFLLAIFFLPIFQTINHWFFGAFMAISGFILITQKKQRELVSSNKFFLLAISILFLIKVISMFHAFTFNYGLKEVTRALPFILYPVAILSLKQDSFQFKDFEKNVFYALILGCLITALICWGNVIFSLKPDDIPANQIFGWKKSGSYLTGILDLHPPYLGLLLVASILFLLNQLYYSPKKNLTFNYIKLLFVIILIVFLFNITARNAFFYLCFTVFGFLIYNKKWKLLLAPTILFLFFNLIIINHPSKYYRLKMYDMLGITNKTELKDKRFNRLEASYNAFKLNPVFGVGAGYDHEVRMEEYKRLNFIEAYKGRHNSHNQFFEYLVSDGIFGATLFLFVICFWVCFLFKNHEYFYLLLVCNIIFASLTESVFERVLGVQYFSLIIGLALLAFNSKKVQNSI
jgi:O-antigen ligase